MHLAYLGQGGSYHVHKWLPALVEAGLRVTLISYTRPDVDLPGVEVRVLEPPFGSPGRAVWYVDFWMSSRPLRRLLAEIEADVLMASYATNYGWLGLRTGFRPMMAQTWTADLTVYPWRGWKRWIFRPMVRRFLHEADLITTDGPALAEAAHALFPDVADKVVPVRWGIRLSDYTFSDDLRHAARAEWNIPQDAPVLTHMRGLDHWYRSEQVLPALLRLLDEHPEAYAVVLTLGHERDEPVQRLLDQLDAHPRGRVFDRFLPREEVQRVWVVTDAAISVPWNDGVSEALLEVLYAGCIPVVSDIPSNRSFLEDGQNAVFVKGDPDRIEDLTATFTYVLDHLPHLKAKMIERNRQWVAEEASVERTAYQVARMVHQVARR